MVDTFTFERQAVELALAQLAILASALRQQGISDVRIRMAVMRLKDAAGDEVAPQIDQLWNKVCRDVEHHRNVVVPLMEQAYHELHPQRHDQPPTE